MKPKKKVVVIEVETNLNNDMLKERVRYVFSVAQVAPYDDYITVNQVQVNLVKSPKK